MEVEVLGRDGVMDVREILLHVVEGVVPLLGRQLFRRDAVDAPSGHAQRAQRLGVVRQVREARFDVIEAEHHRPREMRIGDEELHHAIAVHAVIWYMIYIVK